MFFSHLLIDCGLKGAALLLLAGLAALLLRRDSAATRHLVWLMAMIALLLEPVLSLSLPQWRVLPEWTQLAQGTTNAAATSTITDTPVMASPAERERPKPASFPIAEAPPASVPAAEKVRLAKSEINNGLEAPKTSSLPSTLPSYQPRTATRSRVSILGVVWASGFSLLLLRLLAARWMLWAAERRAPVITPRDQAEKFASDPLVIALQSAKSQVGICGSIHLLAPEEKTIPMVWGLFRRRLMLPAEARNWKADSLQSVLLHELAHLKRRDAMGQLVTQLTCALYWFNPLVWLAAWQLGVERERACDDLVLASGVRASAYAGHLLHVVTEGSPANWRGAGALAMARKSSLEGRLTAVLSEKQNRRSVSGMMGALALLVTLGIAMPVAMLRAAEQQAIEQPPQAVQPLTSERLSPGLEAKLQWGKVDKGLRAALAIRDRLEGSQRGRVMELYLVVQNISEMPIPFSDRTSGKDLRHLRLRLDGKTMLGLTIGEPSQADVLLAPREAIFLPVFPPSRRKERKPSEGELFSDGLLEDHRQSLLANLNIATAPSGAWTGKLETGESKGAQAMAEPFPSSKEGIALMRVWRQHARANGDIPGGLVARLDDKVKEFIRNNTGDAGGDSFAKKMAPIAPKLESKGDWKASDVAMLIDEIATASTIPLETTLEELTLQTMKTGYKIHDIDERTPWGATQSNGLRMAWTFSPRAKEYRIDTPLKSRIILHNAGKETVVFRARTWHQSAGHKAHDAKGVEVKIDSTYWTTISRIQPFRLAPGEMLQLDGAGIGVGANRNTEDWQGTRVGSWIDAKAGDEITFTPDIVPLNDWNETSVLDGEPTWWPNFITQRLKLEAPLPASEPERTRILGHVMRDLFGAAPSKGEVAAFVSDTSADPLEVLADRLATRTGINSFAGPLPSGVTKFRVLPVDPDAAKKPRTASNPGRYTLGENVRLVVSRRPVDEKVVNEARIEFYAADSTKPAPGKPYELKLPGGYDSWAAAWIKGSRVLWVKEWGRMRKIDFSNPADVKESDVTDAKLHPPEIVDAVRPLIAPNDAPATVEK